MLLFFMFISIAGSYFSDFSTSLIGHEIFTSNTCPFFVFFKYNKWSLATDVFVIYMDNQSSVPFNDFHRRQTRAFS